jgi:hypothetical protein
MVFASTNHLFIFLPYVVDIQHQILSNGPIFLTFTRLCQCDTALFILTQGCVKIQKPFYILTQGCVNAHKKFSY